jgi:hypothetical protein
MVYKSSGTISRFILSLADWIMLIKRIDLYNKSRMTGDCQVRFCERLEGETPFANSTNLPFIPLELTKNIGC